MKRSLHVIDGLARALVARAEEESNLPRVISDCRAVAAAFAGHPELRHALEHPSLPTERRQALLRSSLDGSIHPFVLNAFSMLLDHRLLASSALFVDRIRGVATERGTYRHVRVESADTLSMDHRESLEATVQTAFGPSVDLEETVRPNLSAGIILEVGDVRFDGSLTGCINRFQQSLQT
ncbi:ATP synthase F1 subunit delta [Candidatus Uhrbacteria bacterium]|nr:ATP synthase F1 subunit delta [Candidatus Uhrbacteria bacterium]